MLVKCGGNDQIKYVVDKVLVSNCIMFKNADGMYDDFM